MPEGVGVERGGGGGGRWVGEGVADAEAMGTSGVQIYMGLFYRWAEWAGQRTYTSKSLHTSLCDHCIFHGCAM